MASTADYRRLLAGALTIAVTAILLWFGTGLDPVWPLLWLAPLPVLVFCARASWWSAAIVAAVAWTLGALNLWHYLHGVLRLPAAAVAQIYGSEALVFVIAVLLYRALVRGGAWWSAIVAFAATRVAAEYLINITSPHGTAGNLAYSQLGFLPFLQVASVTGPWAMTLLVLGFSAALATAWQVRGSRRQVLRILGPALGALGLVVGFGAVRLAQPAGPTVKVGLVASDPPISPDVADEGAATATLFQAYAGTAAGLAARGAQVIVLPEKLGVAVGPGTAAVDAEFQALAERTRAMIVVGLIRVGPPVKYNEARIYAPGAPVTTYHKQHMLPPYERGLEPGTTLALIAQRLGAWGVEICKDLDFTQPSRDYGQAGTGLLLVPAWDFNLDRTSHGHMAVMRGVESGFAIVRAAKQGYLTVSDNRGRIVAETTSDAAPFATLLADVPVTHTTTLYLRLGDWFAWLTLLALGATVVQLVRLARASPRGHAARS